MPTSGYWPDLVPPADPGSPEFGGSPIQSQALELIREELDLERLNFQMVRRSHATRAIGERKGQKTCSDSLGTRGLTRP
jgi:hypothetical protein